MTWEIIQSGKVQVLLLLFTSILLILFFNFRIYPFSLVWDLNFATNLNVQETLEEVLYSKFTPNTTTKNIREFSTSSKEHHTGLKNYITSPQSLNLSPQKVPASASSNNTSTTILKVQTIKQHSPNRRRDAASTSTFNGLTQIIRTIMISNSEHHIPEQ